MYVDQAFQFGHGLGVPAQGEVGFDPAFGGDQAEFVQAGGLGLGDQRRVEVLEHPAAPQVECLPQQRGGPGRVAEAECFPPEPDELFEARRVELGWVGEQAVAGAAGGQRAGRPGLGEAAPQVGDVGAEGDFGSGGWRRAPQRLGETAWRDELVEVEQQDGQQLPPFRPAERDGLPTGGDVERAEDPEPQGRR
nr:hypothetical protein [Amycolatopsis methanolica]